MKSLGSSIAQLMKQSSKQAFNFPLEKIPEPQLTITESNSEYDYQTKYPVELYEQNKEQMIKYWGSNQLLPRGMGEEIIDQLPKNNLISNTLALGSGELNIRLNDKTLQDNIHNLSQNNGLEKTFFNLTEELKSYIDTENKIGVFYPVGEINKKVELNTFRSLNKAESMHRLLELCGQQSQRIALLDNYSPFHGIILGFIYKTFYVKDRKAKPSERQLQRFLTMENIAQFLADENLTTDQKIIDFGIEQLNCFDKEIFQLYNQLTETAEHNIMQIYTYFLGRYGSIIIKPLKEQKYEFYENYEKQIKHNQAPFSFKDNAVYVKNNQQNGQDVKILENEHYFTQIGKEYCMIKNLEKQDYNTFLFFSDFQDQYLFQDLQSISDISKILYFGSGNLFYENTDDVHLNNYDNLFDNLRYTTMQDMKEKFKDIDHLNLEQRSDEIFAQSLGWTRYLDHCKDSNVGYIMKCENVSRFIIDNENLTNIRFELNEMLSSYNPTIQNSKFTQRFKFQNDHERLLARVLLRFPDEILDVLRNKNFKNLTQYLLILQQTYNSLKENQLFEHQRTSMSEQEQISKVTLIKATLNTFSNLYYILGILNQ